MKTLIANLKKNEKMIRSAAGIIFCLSFAVFLAILLLERLLPGFVTNHFNPAGILIIALLSSIISQSEQ
jgi:hypothetical protein